jgi:hypothetical protein
MPNEIKLNEGDIRVIHLPNNADWTYPCGEKRTRSTLDSIDISVVNCRACVDAQYRENEELLAEMRGNG